MMPRDTNPLGSIFGGVILSHIDSAGAIGARHEIAKAGGQLPFLVTVAIRMVSKGGRMRVAQGGVPAPTGRGGRRAGPG